MQLFIIIIVSIGLFVVIMQLMQVSDKKGYERGKREFFSVLDPINPCPKDTFVLIKTIHNECYVAEWRGEDNRWYCNRGMAIYDPVVWWKNIY